jgi:DNA-binding response OmpR family regulator
MVAEQEQLRVLVVEDDADLRRILKLHLEADGFGVADAEDGTAAFDYLQDDVPDCIVLDLFMPGMDGFAFLKRLRSIDRTRDLPVVILTASEDCRDRTKGEQYQADVYMNKPCDFQELAATLRRLCR